ncbi:MAG: type II secretion system protein, partial [Alphaproteobacteria bacterium]|nr:type II secretion system protein [Alphaproteobacteria bacterium]
MKQFEKGRSMIEMLGVLAIIGVLSVGGLSGYTMAMNRHRA